MSGWADIVWRELAWFWLALFPWLLIGFRWLAGIRSREIYAEPALLPWAQTQQEGYRNWTRHWRRLLSGLAWLLFAAAMAGPRVAQSVYSGDEDQLPELMIVLDVSRSMSARDITPSRLERARLELHDLIARAHGWKMGIVLYAGQPHLLVPPTPDKSLLRYYLQLPRQELLPSSGSDLVSALRYAAMILRDNDQHRSLLLVSDGDIEQNDADYHNRLQDTVSKLHQMDTTLHVLGIGSPEGAPLIAGDGNWLQYQGKTVLSRLQRDLLKRLSRLGGGRYADVSDTYSEWDTLYTHGILPDAGTAIQNRSQALIVWHELFIWCLLPAVTLLLVANWQPPHNRPAGDRAALLSLVISSAIALMMLSTPRPAQAAGTPVLQQAHQAYVQRQYQQAQQLYRRLPGYTGRMGEGSSAFRLGDYTVAVQQFTLAVLAADTDAARADALFNLANSYYQFERYTQAIAVYQDVLQYRQADEAARHNLALARQLVRQQQETAADTSNRQGQGPRSRRFGDDEVLSRGSLILDDKSESKPFALAGSSASATGHDLTEEFMGAALADDEIKPFEDRNWDYTISSVESIGPQLYSRKVDESHLWQQLFESEEGYPAPLEEPRSRPGVKPW